MCIGVDVQIPSQEEGLYSTLFPSLVKGSVQQIEKYIKISATHRLSIDDNKQFFFFPQFNPSFVSWEKWRIDFFDFNWIWFIFLDQMLKFFIL